MTVNCLCGAAMWGVNAPTSAQPGSVPWPFAFRQNRLAENLPQPRSCCLYDVVQRPRALQLHKLNDWCTRNSRESQVGVAMAFDSAGKTVLQKLLTSTSLSKATLCML